MQIYFIDLRSKQTDQIIFGPETLNLTVYFSSQTLFTTFVRLVVVGSNRMLTEVVRLFYQK